MLLVHILLQIIYFILYSYMVILLLAGALSLARVNDSLNSIVIMIRALTLPPCRILVKRFPQLIVKTQTEKGDVFVDLSPVALLFIIGCLLIIVQNVSSAL